MIVIAKRASITDFMSENKDIPQINKHYYIYENIILDRFDNAFDNGFV